MRLRSGCRFSKTVRVKRSRIPRRLRKVRRLTIITVFTGDGSLRASRDVERVRVRKARKRRG